MSAPALDRGSAGTCSRAAGCRLTSGRAGMCVAGGTMLQPTVPFGVLGVVDCAAVGAGAGTACCADDPFSVTGGIFAKGAAGAPAGGLVA